MILSEETTITVAVIEKEAEVVAKAVSEVNISKFGATMTNNL